MEIKRAIEWMERQRDVGIEWDEYTPESAMIRYRCEKEIRESYDLAIKALEEKYERETAYRC